MIQELKQKFVLTRAYVENLCSGLAIEDYSLQPIVDVSPPKWHLAHTTWFFEQFVLVPYAKDYKVFDKDFSFLFNSYYNNVGNRVLRPNRGLMSRPTVEKIYEYRTYVTEEMIVFLSSNISTEVLNLVEIGIQHEQQHAELLAYDIKYILGHQVTFPTVGINLELEAGKNTNFVKIEEGVYEVGYEGGGFCFDNELGRHKVYLSRFEIANQLVTNGEYLAFMNDGGYSNFNLWHAEGWDFIQRNELRTPLYWHKINKTWKSYHYDGLNEINMDLPVMHISFYEAHAFAEWSGMRLPTEFEWEVAADKLKWGQLWEWTNSAYLPYPGFKKAAGALGEYNGKFMINQHVLKGSSIATMKGHSRKTYRNFFHPQLRWMYAGIRLVK